MNLDSLLQALAVLVDSEAHSTSLGGLNRILSSSCLVAPSTCTLLKHVNLLLIPATSSLPCLTDYCSNALELEQTRSIILGLKVIHIVLSLC